jgi:hypothetical protein
VQSGSLVIYTADPLLFGKLIVIRVHEDGRLECEAVHKDSDGNYARDLFSAQELELAATWEQQTA